MSLKKRVFCLISLRLLLAVFGAGTATAVVSVEDLFDAKVEFNDKFKHLLDYNVTIYVMGDTVTIVNNFNNTGYPVRKVNQISSDSQPKHDVFNNFYTFKKSDSNIIQFNFSDLTKTEGFNPENNEFKIYLFGALGENV